MNRRDFLAANGAALLGTLGSTQGLLAQTPKAGTGSGMAWHRDTNSGLFDRISVDDLPLTYGEGVGLFDGFCYPLNTSELGPETSLGTENPKAQCGPVKLSLSHRLLSSTGGAKEDLLEATLKLTNTSGQSCDVLAGFLTGVRPCRDATDQEIYVPITARGMTGHAYKHSCHQALGFNNYLAHYLEQKAGDPRDLTSDGLLLAPVVDLFARHEPCHVALFGTSTEPMFFQANEGRSATAWRLGRQVHLTPGQSVETKAFLLIHPGDAGVAWKAFHRFGHHEDFPPIEWTHNIRTHYYDFLSGVTADGPRGGGYDADLKHFGQFHIGMATQHGYYLSYGDFIHPDRKEWPAMPNDANGPVTMSLEKIKARVDATRRAGVHPTIYLHYTILDEGSPLFEKMRDSLQVGADGKPIGFGWVGPDVIKKTWKMSVASPEWRKHLIQQAQWVMEYFNPDGIVLDETFTAWGWDYHPNRTGPLSPGGIELMRGLREVVHSFGPDKALFASDCSMGNFCLWGDGEAGDHCYDRLLGNPLYLQEPVRYMAALGDKAWQPCAWLFKSLWSKQMELARKVGAGVSLTNGWGDNIGLARLSEPVKQHMIRDINSLLRG